MAAPYAELYVKLIFAGLTGKRHAESWPPDGVQPWAKAMKEAIPGTQAQVAISTAVTLWAKADANQQLQDFELALLVADRDLMLEQVIDVGGTPRVNSNFLRANIPFIIPSSVAYNGTAADFAGTLDKIEKLLVKNLSTVVGETANVWLFMIDDT